MKGSELDLALGAALRGERIAEELERRGFGESYLTQLGACGLPVARAIARRVFDGGEVPIVGINGSQGSGKTTFAAFLAILLEEACDLLVATASIDDFYLTRAERQALAERVHPLLATRGVPGTHDVDLALRTIESVRERKAPLPVPRFDKSQDDRFPDDEWSVHEAPVDVLLFEGWCVGCRPQPAEALVEPVNALEAQDDADGAWRSYVNDCLRGRYGDLFGTLDLLLMLRVPSFDCVLGWRRQQEEELIAELEARGRDTGRAMSPAEVERFIAHYERLTRYMLEDLPARSDAVIAIDRQHRMIAIAGPLIEDAGGDSDAGSGAEIGA